MPRYIYTAKSQPQKTIQGIIEAETEQEAINKLNKSGYFPISVTLEDITQARKSFFGFGIITKKEITLFTRQLSTLLTSGVNIINSLNILAKQTENKHFRLVLNDIITKIKEGFPLSESFASYPKLFSGLYTSIIHSGEIGGHLEEALQNLSDFMEKEEEFKSSLQSSLVYPLFIIAVSTLTVIILIGFVIPRLVVMFKDMGQNLPISTQILINLSEFLQGYWWIILAVIALIVFSLIRIYKTLAGRLVIDKIRLKLPILGLITLKTNIGRLMRTLSLLLSSSMPIVYSIEISKSVISNQVIKNEILRFKDKLSSGSSLSSCMKDSKIFPDFVITLINTGEESGTLEKSLLRIADEYEKEADRALKSLTRLLEPIIILIMGLIVGFIVISMLLPIFQLNLIVK